MSANETLSGDEKEERKKPLEERICISQNRWNLARTIMQRNLHNGFATLDERTIAGSDFDKEDALLLKLKEKVAARTRIERDTLLKDPTANTLDKARVTVLYKKAQNAIFEHKKTNLMFKTATQVWMTGGEQVINRDNKLGKSPFSKLGCDDTWGNESPNGKDESFAGPYQPTPSLTDDVSPSSQETNICQKNTTTKAIIKSPVQAVSESHEPPQSHSKVGPSITKQVSQRSRQDKKRNRTKSNTAKSMKRAGGSRIFSSKSHKHSTEKNNRQCLLSAIMRILPGGLDDSAMQTDLASSVPEHGDTPISNVSKVLITRGIVLAPATRNYHKKKGPEYHLLQETSCSLIVNVKLTNTNHQHMHHFIAWDGEIIHDHPHSIIVEGLDRVSRQSCKAVFGEIFKQEAFHSWQICNVYEMKHVTDIHY